MGVCHIIGYLIGLISGLTLAYVKHRLTISRSKRADKIKEIDNKLEKLYAPFYINLIKLFELMKNITKFSKKMANSISNNHQIDKLGNLAEHWEEKRLAIIQTQEDIKEIISKNFDLIEKDDEPIFTEYFQNSFSKWFMSNTHTNKETNEESFQLLASGTDLNILIKTIFQRKQHLSEMKKKLLHNV